MAVSGGADSTALLRVLHSLTGKLGISVAAAHIHHGLRGEEADRDAEAVRSLADAIGVPCFVEGIDLSAVVNGSGNVEDAARHGRYHALAEIAQRENFDCAATAHTKSDQAETVLHRMTRSAGPSGLRGIRPAVEFCGVRFIRPLVDISRREVLRYLEAVNQTWREDKSNQDTGYSRNRIRHVVLPELQAINPDVETALSRLADILAADEEFFDSRIAEVIREIVVEKSGEWEMEVAQLRVLPDAVRWRLWRTAAERVAACRTGLSPKVLVSFEQLKQLDRLALGQEGRGEVQLRAGIVAKRIHGKVRLATRRQDPDTTA